jgi:tetratricopeptide (TPR) repeat protein
MSSAARFPRSGARRPLGQAALAAVCAVALAAASTAPRGSETKLLASGPVEIRVAQNGEVSRIELRGALGARAKLRREGQSLIAALPLGAHPDLARLHVDPPHGVTSVVERDGKGGPELVFVLADGMTATTGSADGGVFINIAAAPASPAKVPVGAPTGRADPVPPSGVVKVEAHAEGQTLRLRLPWAAPVGAAVFRRGGAIWVVFDAKARLDMPATAKISGGVRNIQWVQGPDCTIIRIDAPEWVAVDAEADGSAWVLDLGGTTSNGGTDLKLGRDDQTGPTALTVALAGAQKVIWLRDPVIGDRLAVVAAPGPIKALHQRRDYVEASLLASVQGLAIQAQAADLKVVVDGDLVRISRPRGLSLSAADAGRRAALPAQMPQPALMPALVDFAKWPDTGGMGFSARYAQLQALAYAEASGGTAAPVAARMAFARFLVGTELGYEAIGVLDLLQKQNGAMSSDAEFRGLRGAARAMVGRYKEAAADFSVPSLANDPSSAVWRAYIDTRLGDWANARRSFLQGSRAIDLFAPVWKARFAAAHARAALETGDLHAAGTLIDYALAQKPGAIDQLTIRLVQARLFELEGQTDRALAVYKAISRAPIDYLSAPALLRATKIRLDAGLIKPDDAVGILEGLKYRWRGDATELEITRILGEIYLSQGRYREALDALRGVGRRLPDLPEAQKLQTDLAQAFRSLFLEGRADALEPIQALAIFYDFRELTPVGAEGDEMVRRLSRRLVDVDLLDQAAELLKYQVEHRLDGVAKGQVATDLAIVELMNHKPELALQAIASSRTTLLPNALNAQRRVVEARALSDLGRYDQALELLGKDNGGDALDLRAEIAWKQQNWADVGQLLEKRLGDRWKGAGPLTGEEETRLIRAGIGYSLARDEKGLERLTERYSGFIDQAKAPDALRLALSRFDVGIAPADFARAAAQADTFTGWVATMKQRFHGPAFK